MNWILLVFLIWLGTIALATVAISFYIKKFQRSDAAVACYVIYLAVSQILAAKVGDFSIGSFVIEAPVAVLIFPFTFQITDMVNEFFGQKETHRMILIAFITQVLMSFFLWLSIEVPSAIWWPNQVVWTEIFGQTLRITGASWISFLITENLDALIYAQFKKWTKGKYLWLRNLISDIPTLALDSVIFVTIAFVGVFPIGPLILGQLLTKWFFGIIDTPFMYLSRAIVGKREDDKSLNG